jgi:hypothetical protein
MIRTALAARRLRWVACLCGALGARAAAQPVIPDAQDYRAGSAAEARVLDECSVSAGMPVSIRPFSPLAIDALRKACGTRGEPRGLRRSPAWLEVQGNTARAASADGPVWAGRGATVSASAGWSVRWSALSAALRPLAFLTQNLSYSPSRTITRVEGEFADPWIPVMDRPYRQGAGAYGRIDAGESYLRVDSRWVAVGLSTAGQAWGPARMNPLVLGTHAGGFPHAFVETGQPTRTPLGSLSARWVVGRLVSSSAVAFRDNPPADARIGVGAVATWLLPASLAQGLEVGGSRFFHVYDTPAARDMTTLTLPFSGILKSSLGDLEKDDHAYNQLASIFARLAPLNAGVEVYGEYYREDHSVDLRDFAVEPDHSASYMVGLRRVWRGDTARQRMLTLEAVNGRISHLERVRSQSPPHTHSPMHEGHTLRGKPLASPMLAGGGGLLVELDLQRSEQRWVWTGGVTRYAQNAEGGTWNGDPTGFYTLGVMRERRLGVSRRWGGRGMVVREELRIEPPFGDMRGTNITLRWRGTR